MTTAELQDLVKKCELYKVTEYFLDYYPVDSVGKYIVKKFQHKLNDMDLQFNQTKQYEPYDQGIQIISDGLLKVIQNQEELKAVRSDAEKVKDGIMEEMQYKLDALKTKIDRLEVENRQLGRAAGFWIFLGAFIVGTILLLSVLDFFFNFL